jgi:hypothetical protein
MWCIIYLFIDLVFSFSLGSTSCLNGTASGSNAPGAATTAASSPTTGAAAATGTTPAASKAGATTGSTGSSYVSHDYPRLHN